MGSLKGISLKASDKRNRIARSEERVFTSSLLASAPSWVPKDVDIRSPEREAIGLASIEDCPGFDADGVADSVPEAGVEGGGGEDDLREAGGGGDGGVVVEEDAGADS